MVDTDKLTDQKPVKIDISDEEWKEAKELQQQKLQDRKIRRKDQDKENKLKHSFISVNDPASRSTKLYGLANNGQVLGVGEFGKTKLAIDEEGNCVAVKIITTVHTLHDIITSNQIAPNEDSEVKIEAKLGRNKGSFSMYSPSRKPRKRVPGGAESSLSEDEVAIKKYQLVEYLGVSLKDIVEGKKDKTGKIITPQIHLSDEQKIEIAYGLLEAVKHLHDLNILHNDLHPGNILVDLNKKPIKVCVIDFGLSYELKPNETEVSIIGRPFNKNVLPPEIENRSHTFLSKKTDSWQVANVLFRTLGLEEWYVYSLLSSFPKTRANIDDEFLASVKVFHEEDKEAVSSSSALEGKENDFIPTDGGYGMYIVQRDNKENNVNNKNIENAEQYLEQDGIHGQKNAHKRFTF